MSKGKKLTVEDVKERVRDIKTSWEETGDYEHCHSAEDDLHFDVLRTISRGASNAKELAAEAIKTEKIDFPRHTA